jgi:Ubiquitin family/PB1 domain
MKLIVKTLNQKSYELDVQASTTVGDIKNKLDSEHQFPFAHQKLIYAGKILADHDKTLGECNFSEGAFMVLMLKQPKVAEEPKPQVSEPKPKEVPVAAAPSPSPPAAVPSASIPAPSPQPPQVSRPKVQSVPVVSASSASSMVGASMMIPGNIVLKLCFANQIRRFPLAQLSIDEVVMASKMLFPGMGSLQLTYQDEDGDTIIVASDLDLQVRFKSFDENEKRMRG